MRKAPTLAALLGAILLAGGLTAGCGGSADVQASPPGPRPLTAEEADAGIKVERVMLTASGAMVDVRYTVVDADRALTVLGDTTGAYAPYLEAGGRIVPLQEVSGYGDLTGSGHGAVFRTGTSYYWVFTNRGGELGRGAEVDLVLGELRLEGLVIE